MRLVDEVEAVEVDGIDERGSGLGFVGGRLLAEGGAVDDGLAPAQLRVGGKDDLSLAGAVLLVQQEVDPGRGASKSVSLSALNAAANSSAKLKDEVAMAS